MERHTTSKKSFLFSHFDSQESLITRRKRKDDQKNLELTLFRVRFSDGNFFQTVEQPTDYPLLISFSPGATTAMLWEGGTTLHNNLT
jgi:hypothetical protein